MEKSQSLFRVGLLYMSYRLVVAIIILLICLVDFAISTIYNHFYYLGFVFLYLIFTLLQFLFYLNSGYGKNYVTVGGWVDICCFAIFNYAFGHLGVHVTFLYIITLFVLSLVQEKRVTILLTLAAIIFVSYFSFIDSWMSRPDGLDFLNSLFLTLLFLVVSTLGVMFGGRFKLLEAANLKSATQLEGFREISNRVMEQIDTGYMVVTQNNNLVMINPAAQKVLNLPMEKGLVVTDFIPGLAGMIQKNTKISRFRFSESFQIDNKEYFISYSLLTPGEMDSLCLLTIEDMSDISNRVRYLKLAALGQLSASIAHEIRNPLTSIYQANALMEGAEPERMKRYSEIIGLQCDRINNIVESTLNMAKNHVFNPSPIRVDAVLRDLLEQDIASDYSRVLIDIPEGVVVLFDEGHFRQVFQNLINNALRHNDFNKSSFIQVTTEVYEDKVFINVLDFGEGVEEIYLGKLFEAFFTTEIDGTGLGLHLCKNLCETNHAKIIYNKIDNKTCFQVQCQKFQHDVV